MEENVGNVQADSAAPLTSLLKVAFLDLNWEDQAFILQVLSKPLFFAAMNVKAVQDFTFEGKNVSTRMLEGSVCQQVCKVNISFSEIAL